MHQRRTEHSSRSVQPVVKAESLDEDRREHLHMRRTKIEPLLVDGEGEMLGLGTPGAHIEVEEGISSADRLGEGLRVDDAILAAVRFPVG